jgi:NTE family protein
LIVGAADAGIDVRDADLFVGTSAGAVVAAQVTSGLPPEALFQQQVDPDRQVDELTPPVDFNQMRADLAAAKDGSGGPIEVLRRIGTLALAASTVSEFERRQVIASRLPVPTWPEQRLLVVAVDTERAGRHVFDRTSGPDLVDAVAASCAVPGVWPPVTISGRRYIDGGVYSTDNADLATGSDLVLMLTLPPRVPPIAVVTADATLETLRRSGARVEVVHPDEATEAAFASVGGNLLDPSVRAQAARAGREQGRSLAGTHIVALWQ